MCAKFVTLRAQTNWEQHMRRFTVSVVALLAGIWAFAQAQITTKKEKLSDFPVKTMKVVLTGNDFIDPAFKEAVKNTWQLSPYEFCGMEEFNALKSNEDYYFLVPMKARFGKETKPGVMMLSLMKGRAGAEGMDDMLDVVSIPLCAADIPSGREAAIMPGLVDIIQGYVSKSLSSGFKGLRQYVRHSLGGKKVYMAEGDLSSSAKMGHRSKKRVEVVPDAVADSVFMDGGANAIVSYCVAPAFPEKGSVCWRMLIDARTHALHYYRRRGVSSEGEVGFRKQELRRIGAR